MSVGQCKPSALELYGFNQLVAARSNSSGKKEMAMAQTMEMN